MRREWGPWIKTRQWHEFERLAKKDPSQPLADTVGELERGFSEKADRRALRKILFLLGQAGYRPQAIDEAAATVEEPGIDERAWILSPGPSGDVTLGLARRSGSKWRAICVDAHPLQGIEVASEFEEDGALPFARLERQVARNMARRVSAEVPVEFARLRIAQELRRTKGTLPTVVAFWRSHLEAPEVFEHPAERLPRDPVEIDAFATMERLQVSCLWRLELGTAVQCLYDRVSDEANVGLDGLVETSTAKVFTPELVASRAYGLLDLAYAMHLAGRKGSGEIAAMADDLRAKGGGSRYAEDTLALTLVALREYYREEKLRSGKA